MGAMDPVDSKRTSFVPIGTLGKKSSVNGSPLAAAAHNLSGQQMRRPFGVAAIDLTPIIKNPDDFKNNLDLPFVLCEKDNMDTTLKKLLVNKDVSKIDSKLAVSVELLHGDVKQVSIILFSFNIFFMAIFFLNMIKITKKSLPYQLHRVFSCLINFFLLRSNTLAQFNY